MICSVCKHLYACNWGVLTIATERYPSPICFEEGFDVGIGLAFILLDVGYLYVSFLLFTSLLLLQE